MSSVDWVGLGTVIVLILLAAILSAAEVSITRMTKIRASRLLEEKRRGATSLGKVVEDPARYLNVVLLLTLLFQLASTTIAGVMATRLLAGYGEVVATLVMTVLLFVFAEAMPKTFTVQHTDRVALRLAPVILGVGKAFGPIARLLIGLSNVILPGKGLKEGPFVTEAEIRAMADVASKEASIAEEEKRLIHSIFEFGDTIVREIMTPRPDIVAASVCTPLSEVIDLIISHGYSRFPVFDANLDDVVGVLYVKDVVRELHTGRRDRPLAEIAQPAHFVPESKRVAELLKEMQKDRFLMAIVVDEHGTVIGLVTLEDVLEEIVGEIADEYDLEEPNVQPLGVKRYRVNARMPVSRLSERLGVDLPSSEWDTVGGLMLGVLGHVPSQGERVELENLRFTAERVHGRRIFEVLVEQIEPTEARPVAG